MNVPYVGSESANLAASIEKRFINLPPDAGVLFVSVAAVPILGGISKSFEVRLGIARKYDEDVGWALINQVLSAEIQSQTLNITASVYRGTSGAGRDESSKGPDSAKA